MPKQNGYRISALEALVARIIPGNSANSHSQKFVEVGAQFLKSVKALRDLDAAPNPAESSDAHERRIATAAKRLHTKVTELDEQLLQTLKTGQEEIDAKIKTKVNFQPDTKYEGEIRSVFRSLPHDGRLAMLQKFAVENDAASMAAIVSCPAILCDINPDLQHRFKSQMLEMHAPAEMAQSKALLQAMEPLLAASRVARDYATDFCSPALDNPARTASVRRDKEAALAALAAFDTAVS